MKVEVTSITPALAEELLSANTANRPKSGPLVDRWAAAMERGEWRVNGDTVRVGKSGILLDGQHRLAAIVKTGLSQTSILVTDLEDDVFTTIDQGKKRSAGDVLATHNIQHYNHAAHAARLMLLYKLTGNPYHGAPDKAPTADQIYYFVLDHPEVVEACSFCSGSKWLRKYIGAGSFAFMHLVFSDVSESAANAFFDELASGMVSYKHSPILLLRDRLMEDKSSKVSMKSNYKAGLVFKAFKSFFEQKPMKTLRIRTEGASPEKDWYSLPRRRT